MSRNILLYLFPFLLLSCGKLYGQTESICPEVYTHEQLTSEPGFGKNGEQFNKLVHQDIIGVLSSLRKEYEIEISTLRAKMIIGPRGKILEVKFITKLPKIAERKIETFIRTSTIWQAGKINGQEVCSEFNLFINCVKWMR